MKKRLVSLLLTSTTQEYELYIVGSDYDDNISISGEATITINA